MTNPILSNIQLAARLTDYLYHGSYVSSDSAQALFDVLADALEKRPDIVAGVAEDIAAREESERDWLADLNARLAQLNKGEQV